MLSILGRRSPWSQDRGMRAVGMERHSLRRPFPMKKTGQCIGKKIDGRRVRACAFGAAVAFAGAANGI